MNLYRRSIGWLLLASVCVSFVSISRGEATANYLDVQQPLETRVEDLLARLTLEEKIRLGHADSKFTTAAIPRLAIPCRWLSFWSGTRSSATGAGWLADKLNGSGAVVKRTWKRDGSLAVTLRDGGRLLCWSEKPPKKLLCEGVLLHHEYDRESGRLEVSLQRQGQVVVQLEW